MASGVAVVFVLSLLHTTLSFSFTYRHPNAVPLSSRSNTPQSATLARLSRSNKFEPFGISMSGEQNDRFLQWAEGNGAWVSPKIRLSTVMEPGDESDQAGINRGFFSNEHIANAERILTLPASSLALSAKKVREEKSTGTLGAFLRSWDEDSASQPTEEEALASVLTLSRLTDGFSFAPFWTAELRSSLPAEAARRAEEMRRNMDASYQRFEDAWKRFCEATDTEAPEWTRDDFEWAWAQVTSRALREGVMGGGDATWTKICLPVADLFNHEPNPLPASVPAESMPRLLGTARGHRGPSVTAQVVDSDYVFMASRDIEPDEEVTWTYGPLSNEDLLLLYGFVPDPPVHGDNRFGFSLPPQIFESSIAKLEKEVPCAADVGERKRSLLAKLGATETNDALLFDVMMGCEPTLFRPGERAAPLSLLARVMCLSTADELATLALSDPAEGTGKIKSSNEARALRWCAWLMDQVYSQTFGSEDDSGTAISDDDVNAGQLRWAAQVASDEREVLKMSWLLAQAQARRADAAQTPQGRAGGKAGGGRKGKKKGTKKGGGKRGPSAKGNHGFG